MDGVSARERQFSGTEETRIPEGDTSAADTVGADGNTRNDYDTPPRGIRHTRQFVDTEESVRIRLEKVSEKISDGSVSDYMRRWGLTCQRPIKCARKQDPSRI